MNMNTTSSTSSEATMTMMIPWLHFAGGDNLLFKSLHPSSRGAIAGACIVLIIIAVFERWVAAMRGSLEAHWRQRALAMIEDYNTPGIDDKEKTTEAGIRTISRTNSPSSSHARWTQPFIAAHDIPRGAVYALQVLLGYTLMLAIMTFQAAYLISIIIGSGLGEVLFGKIGGARHVH